MPVVTSVLIELCGELGAYFDTNYEAELRKIYPSQLERDNLFNLNPSQIQ